MYVLTNPFGTGQYSIHSSLFEFHEKLTDIQSQTPKGLLD